MSAPARDASPSEFWDGLYETRGPSNGIPNPVFAAVAAPLAPGWALDLGCALGSDSIWLAARGWRVTGVDISATALRQAAANAAQAGVADRIDFQQHDLAHTFPDGEFDLVSAVYLQSPLKFPRRAVLRRASRAVARGGRLLVVVHGSNRPWGSSQNPDNQFPTPAESLAWLELEAGAWEVERSDARDREVARRDGSSATVTDIVTLVRRL